MSRYSLTDEQLNSEIGDSDVFYLAKYFDGLAIYANAMGLTPAEQADVNELRPKMGTQVAMTECLILWRKHNYAITYKALLELLLGLRKDKIADDICQHLTQCEYYYPRRAWALFVCLFVCNEYLKVTYFRVY